MPLRRKGIKKSQRRYIFVRLCVFVSLWQIFMPLYAQRDTSRLLNTVPVFSQADSVMRISVISSAIPHYVLNEEKLAGLAVTDIGAALKFIPGMQIKDYGGIGGIKTVSFRSLGATHTGVTVDGIKLMNTQSGAINLSSFEIFGVSELGFTSGQTEETNVSASAYLNANTVSIQSQLAKKPEKLTWSLYSANSSISSFEEGVLVSVPLSKKLFLGFQAMTKFGQGDYTFVYKPSGEDVSQKRSNSALFNYKIRSVVGIDLKQSRTLFSVNYFNNEQELPGAIILYNPSNDQKLWNEDFRFSVLHDQYMGNWKLQLNGFYQSAYLRYYDPDFLNLQGFIDNSYRQQNESGGFMIKRGFSKNQLVIFSGSDVIFSQLNGSGLPDDPERIESNSVIGFSTFLKSLKIESNVTLQAVSDKLGLTDTSIEKKFLQTSPFLSLCWMPFKQEAFRVRSFYKRAFTLPTFNDLYYNFIGNTNLKPEKAHLFNLGISYGKNYKHWTAEFSADGFYNLVQDKIVAIPTKDLFNWSMQNIGQIQATGLDAGFLISYQKKNWKMTVNGSYTLNLSLDVTDPESSTYGKQIPYTPFHSGTAGLAGAYKGFCLNINGFYSGFRYSLNENIYANYLAPFTDISVNLSKQFTVAKQYVFRLSASAMNLLNKNYEVIRSFPMPGRYYQFSLNLSFR